jgi:hypothetical protein
MTHGEEHLTKNSDAGASAFQSWNPKSSHKMNGADVPIMRSKKFAFTSDAYDRYISNNLVHSLSSSSSSSHSFVFLLVEYYGSVL